MKYVETIKNLRNDSDIKQYEIAKEIGVSAKTYSMYENEYRHIPIKNLDKILIKFNISLDYILELSKDKNYKNLKRMNFEKYAKNIKETRIELGLSQKEMAKLIGCSQQSLSEYENKNCIMPLEILKLFCIKSNLSADYITGKLKIKKTLDKSN